MQKKILGSLLFLLFCGVVENYNIAPAKAIPAFARKTGLSCSTCHSPTFPRLTDTGWKYKENGYQVSDKPTASEENSFTKPDEYLELLKNLPLAVRVKSNIQLKSAHSNVDFSLPESFELLAGGNIYKNISVFYSQDLGTPSSNESAGVFENAQIIFSNLFRNQLLNVRVGKFPIFDWHFDSEKTLTHSGYLIQNSQIGGNPFLLGDKNSGIEIYGRPENGPVFYHAGIFDSNTTSPDNSLFSKPKDLSMGLVFNLFDIQRLGLFGYYGNSSMPLPADTTGVASTTAPKFSDTGFYNLSASMDLDFDVLKVLGMCSFSQNMNAEKASLKGGFLEVDYPFTPQIFDYSPTIVAIAKGDVIASTISNTTNYDYMVAPAIRFNVIKNLAFVFEYDFDLSDNKKNLGVLKMDTAF